MYRPRARVLLVGDGSSYRRHNKYELRTTMPPTPEELAEEQARLGYHPEGYGSPMASQTYQKSCGEWVTVWHSAASCD